MTVSLTLFVGGSCDHPAEIVETGAGWKARTFPSIFALIQHESFGNLLYDCGYSRRFFELTRAFPFNVYALVTPVSIAPESEAPQQLTANGVSPDSIAAIIISHFHADHVGALADFPTARYFVMQAAYDDIKHRSGFAALKSGFLSGLLPSDFESRMQALDAQRSCALPESMLPFKTGFDLTGDGNIVAVPLPGHTAGHTGLYVRTSNQGEFFLVGDACWTSAAYERLTLPHAITRLICHNPTEYRQTIGALHDLHTRNKDVQIVPSHCSKSLSNCGRKHAGVVAQRSHSHAI